MQKGITDAGKLASKLYDSLKNITDTDQGVSTIKDFVSQYEALDLQIRRFELDEHGYPSNIENSAYIVNMAKCAKIVQEAEDLPDILPKQVDPPIDSVLHSLTFVINYGANVTPSWTLLQWKGPGQSPNFASAAGVRTHNLVISMGPRSGNPAIGDDPIRLIQLQAIRSINQQ